MFVATNLSDITFQRNIERRDWRYQRGNQNPKIIGQTTKISRSFICIIL